MVRKLSEPVSLPPPATTLEGREDQLIGAAMDLVERRITEGTASAQETVHFLKLGSVRNRLEQDKLRRENEVLETRVREMESRQSSEGLYAEALKAFKGYSGQEPIDDDEDPDVY
jgi:dihydroxyacetone kinase DhaKLM complex PTS-EIIA-like component DhaM